MPIRIDSDYYNAKVHHLELVNLYGCKIGKRTKIADFVEIGPAIIGDDCLIQAFCYIPAGVTIGDRVFVGPRVTFLNDKYPPSAGKHWKTTIVEDDVAIGGGAVILPGVRLHAGCKIGAGAVVTRDVNPRMVVAGNPAKPIASEWYDK